MTVDVACLFRRAAGDGSDLSSGWHPAGYWKNGPAEEAGPLVGQCRFPGDF